MTPLNYSQNLYFHFNPKLWVLPKGAANGVVEEINPYKENCRANFANDASSDIRKISQKYEDCRFNFEKSVGQVGVSSAFGNGYSPELTKLLANDKEAFDNAVKVLDAILANTLVMLKFSRKSPEDIRNGTRVDNSKFYYNISPLSYLKSYQLFSLVLGLFRMGVHIAVQNNDASKDRLYLKTLFDAVPHDSFLKAINENDDKLALENFTKIKPILLKIVGGGNFDNYPIAENSIKFFEHFVKIAREKGLKYWFPDTVIKHWAKDYTEGHGTGFESFLYGTVAADLQGKKKGLFVKTY